MRNHGLLTCGETVAEAITHMKYLDLSCDVQLRLESAGVPIVAPDEALCELTAHQWERYIKINQGLEWAAYLRVIDRIDRSYAE